jgi:hypothetical protein
MFLSLLFVLNLQLNVHIQMNYSALLQEKVKDPQLEFHAAKKLLEGDPRYRTQHLTTVDKERMFREHSKSLHASRTKAFKTLLRVCIV